MLLERRDKESGSPRFDSSFSISVDRLIRICRYKDLDGELRLLEAENLAWKDEAFQGEGVALYVRIFVRGKSDNFHYDFVDFAETNGIGFTKPLVALDFSDF